MRHRVELLTVRTEQDEEGFAREFLSVVTAVRAYKEDRKATKRWENRAAWTDATALFVIRKTPGLEVSDKLRLRCLDKLWQITSVTDTGGLYLEILARRMDATHV
jgi:head-tail adaptor